MLESERLHDPLMSLLMVFGLFIELFLQSSDPRQVLLLLEQDTVALQVCIFDPLLALAGKLLDSLLLLFVESYALFLVLQQRNQVVILLGTGLQFR